MGSALSSGVTGLQAHQQMLEVAGNNLANVNTYGFKGSSVAFAELLSETIKGASAPNANSGGTNPQEIGTGVNVSSISRNMQQGSMQSTGQALDMAISGAGYFVLANNNGTVYTRVGSFAIDANSMLVDPSTGYRVQRSGTAGEVEGFQTAGNDNIKIPFDAAMPAKATSSFNLSGNLRADGGTPTTTHLSSGTAYMMSDGITKAESTTLLTDLEQFTGTYDAADTITLAGTNKAGTSITHSFTVPAGATIQDVLDEMNSANFLDSASSTGATASLVNGEIQVIDNTSGYSLLDVTGFNYTGAAGAALDTPGYFAMLEAGGQDAQATSIDIFDALGGKHTLSGSFVKTDTANTWDFVLTKMTGDVSQIDDRRITGITFRASDGAFMGVTDNDGSKLSFRFANDPSTAQVVSTSNGSITKFDGLTQFKTGEGIASTAAASNQDGYKAGQLATVSATDGKIIGTFSNGIKKNIATVQLAIFQNPAGLESAGGGYYSISGNSGDPIITESGIGGAGRIEGQKLEKSNVQVAQEFVSMIQAQNGYQANARTISVANEVLRELTNLIR